jgi:hypothetical protein
MRERHGWLPMLASAGLAAWLLALWLLPQPPLLDRTLTRAAALARGTAAARDLGLSIAGLYGAAYPDTALLDLDAEYLRDHPGARPIDETIAADRARASWRVRFSQWDRDDALSLWLGARGELIAFDRSLPEDAPGSAIAQARARQLATELLARQRFDLANAALVESSTITRTNRVDHRFVWQSERIVGEAAHPRVLVAVQGDQVATLSPYLYTPPEYRRERDRTTISSLLQRDTLPLLPDFAALLLIGADLLLATRRPPPLRLIIDTVPIPVTVVGRPVSVRQLAVTIESHDGTRLVLHDHRDPTRDPLANWRRMLAKALARPADPSPALYLNAAQLGRWAAACRKGERLAVFTGTEGDDLVLICVEKHFIGAWKPLSYLESPGVALAESPWLEELDPAALRFDGETGEKL